MFRVLRIRVASACCLKGKNNLYVVASDTPAVASACCLKGKNNKCPNFASLKKLHLPAV